LYLASDVFPRQLWQKPCAPPCQGGHIFPILAQVSHRLCNLLKQILANDILCSYNIRRLPLISPCTAFCTLCLRAAIAPLFCSQQKASPAQFAWYALLLRRPPSLPLDFHSIRLRISPSVMQDCRRGVCSILSGGNVYRSGRRVGAKKGSPTLPSGLASPDWPRRLLRALRRACIPLSRMPASFWMPTQPLTHIAPRLACG